MKNLRHVCALLFALAASPALADSPAAPPPLLDAMFTDHAVLQRDKPIKVWGQAAPGTQVTVSLAQSAVQAQADGAGHWTATLPAMPEGGPYTLTATTATGESQKAADILIGDVWLCTGQSNMVLWVKVVKGSYTEIPKANNDSIRMMTIPNTASSTPVGTFPAPVKWIPTTPQTVGDFSASCYYFGRELQKSVHVPEGLIVAAWGGSKISSWMSEAALRSAGGYDAALDIQDTYRTDPVAAATRWGAVWENWWKTQRTETPWTADYDTSAWPIVPSIGVWDNWGVPELVDHTGLVWYRTSVTLTPEQAAQGAVLNIGTVDEVDHTWVNGAAVGGGSGGDRTYTLPKGLLHAGENSITVNILNTWMLGGLTGPASSQAIHLADGTSVPLTGPWRYSIVPQTVGEPPRAPWEPIGGLSMIYNGMLAPVGPYGVRGALWYQGESDTPHPDQYRKLLAGMMADWRNVYGADLPFLIVQLPDFGPVPTSVVESDWAALREAQRLAVQDDAHASLIVTIDIGDPLDIHPTNKPELGRRIALSARHLVYGEPIIPTGPTATSAVRSGSQIVVSFGNIDGGLVVHGNSSPIEFELCAETPASCRYATTHMKGDTVLLDVPAKFLPTRVRYDWADSPVSTLYDGAGLPAGPFELAIAGSAPPAHAVKHGHPAKQAHHKARHKHK